MVKCEIIDQETCEHVIRPRWFSLPSKEEYYDKPHAYKLPIPAEQITDEEWYRQAIKLFQCVKCGKIGREEDMLTKEQLKERRRLQRERTESKRAYSRKAGYTRGQIKSLKSRDGEEIEQCEKENDYHEI